MSRFYQGDWIDSLSSRFVDELPNENVNKNIQNDFENNDEFEFNQDFESEIKSPGWIRYQKRLK